MMTCQLYQTLKAGKNRNEYVLINNGSNHYVIERVNSGWHLMH